MMAALNQQDSSAAVKSVSSFDSYDAAKTALGRVNPDDLEKTKNELLSAASEIGLDQEDDLDSMIEVFEYVSQNPESYKSAIQDLVNKDYIDAEDFPEDFDPRFLGTVLAMLHEMQQSGVQGDASTVQNKSSVQEDLKTTSLSSGNASDIAQQLASYGRHGDTMLAHITPEEAELLKSRGGSGTINPVTGLPEFFLKKLARKIKQGVKKVVRGAKKVLQTPVGRLVGTVGLATLLGPAGVGLSMATAGAAAGAGTALAAGGSVKEALVSGAMGYIGGGGTVMGASPISAVGQYLPGAAGSAVNTGFATGAIGAGVGKLSGMKTSDALKMGAMSGFTAAAQAGLNKFATKPSIVPKIGEGVFEGGVEQAALGSAPGFLGGGVSEAAPLTMESAGYTGFNVPQLGGGPVQAPSSGLMDWLGKPAVQQAAGQLASAGMQAYAGQQASQQQASAAQAGIEEQRRQFEATRQALAPFAAAGTSVLGNFAPYMGAGLQALGQQEELAGLRGPQAQRVMIRNLEASPEYQALARQGEEAILQRASATGGLRGGNVQAALAQFRPAMLQQLIDQQYQRLGGFAGTGLQTTSQLASMGQSAAAQQGQFGAGAAANIGNLLAAQGEAQAGGTLSTSRAISQALNIPATMQQYQAGRDLFRT